MPHTIVYANTKFDLPGWLQGAFKNQALGYAYRGGDYYVHLYGMGNGRWPISSGLTASETGANGSTRQWSTRIFGARNIRPMALPAGTIIDGVWRLGLYWYDQRMQALKTGRAEQRAAEQLLYLLVSALSDLFLYVEPEGVGLSAFGPKTRQLLLLACTDVEAAWTHYMKRAGVTPTGQGYTTRDYVRLCAPLYLTDYRVTLTPYSNFPKVRPFHGWNATAATKSLPWYDAYNKVKHDRAANLNLATLERCVEAVQPTSSFSLFGLAPSRSTTR